MDLAVGGKHLLDYWSIVVRRRWIVVLAVTTVTLAALIGSFLVTPLYRASTLLQIERQNPDILTFQDLSRVDYSWAAYADFYQTQYKIVASTAVARKAAQRLELTSHPDFAASSEEPGLLARLRALIPRRTQAMELDPLDIAAGQVLAGLEVSPVRNSQLLQIGWVSEDAELAARVANAVADAYIQLNIEAQYSTTDQAQEFLVDQIGTLRKEITAIEDHLQVYGEAKRIVSIGEANNITLQALHDISEKRTAAQTTLAKAEAAYRSVLEAPAEALPEIRDSELIARLRQEYASYEVELSEQSRQFGDSWPGMQTLRSKLDQAMSRLELETDRIAGQVRAARETAYRNALKEVANLDRLLRQQEDAAQRLKRDAVEFANLKDEVQKKRETLDALMGRQNEMALSSRLKDLDSSSTNIRIMETARPPMAPFKPNTRVNVILGLMLGLASGLGLAFFLDYLDNTITSPAELEKVLALPLLAVVPRHVAGAAPLSRGRRRAQPEADEPFDFVAQIDGRSSASEAYRELRTSILLSNPGQPPRQVMISSALPGEGKTATAINLAVVLSQLGRRVLLVDTDLRRPRLHRAFRVDNVRGVSTYLSGMEHDPTQLVTHTEIDNLDLMTSGPVPPNPSELLNSPVFAEMGKTLVDGGYDHVIFDSPPVLSVSDPVIISSVVETGILVVRAGKTPRQSVRMAAAKLQHAGAATFGVVLNDLDAASHGAAYYRYHYYGRYGETESGQPDRERRARGTGA